MTMTFRVGSLFLTGGNRGIGLEMVRQLVHLPEPPKHIFVSCRHPVFAAELKVLAAQHDYITILQLDVRDHDAYGGIVRKISDVVGEAGLNMLFNNAGISHPCPTIEHVNKIDLNEHMEVNTVAPVLLTQAFIPLLRKAAVSSRSSQLSCARAAVVNASSGTSQISKSIGGNYNYRISKCAVNMATNCLHHDLRKDGILSVAVSAGWVLTEIGGGGATSTVEECVSSLLPTMAKLSDEHAGKLVGVDGKVLDW